MDFLSQVKQNYQLLWKAIIRPPKAEYDLDDLGPIQGSIAGVKVRRTDFELVNKMGLKLKCSHFEPVNRVQEELPCVVYLHANSSCRLEALKCIDGLLPNNITLFCFDFAGCGMSEGKYISLGFYERQDVEVVINYLRASKKVSTIGLWGRSMGAVTALMYADRDPSIAGLVLDSPFSNLEDLSRELVATKYPNVPSFLVSPALSMISSTIKKEHNFDIAVLNPLENVKKAFIPAFFIVGQDDDFVPPKHTQKLYEAYAGQKQIKIIKAQGQVHGHNSARPRYIRDSCSIFLYNALHVQQLVKVKSPMKETKEIKEPSIVYQNQAEKLVKQKLKSYDKSEEEMIQEAIRLSLKDSKP